MSAAFFMAGIQSSDLSSSLEDSWWNALFLRARMPAGRVDEVHWFSTQEPGAIYSGLPGHVPSFSWLPQSMSEHFILRSVCQSLMDGGRDLVLLSSAGAWGRCAVLLSSPHAVGRYNALPSGRFVTSTSLSLQDIPSAKDSLETILQSQIDPELIEGAPEEGKEPHLKEPKSIELNWLSGDSEGVIAPIARVLPPEADALWQFNGLMQSLAEEPGSYGLLIHRGPGSALASLFEGV